MPPKTRMTAEEVAAEKAERGAKNPPAEPREMSNVEFEAYKSMQAIRFKTGNLKR